MNSFLSRFYFLSKFTTSLILLTLLIFLTYLFIKAYIWQSSTNTSSVKYAEVSSQLVNLENIVEQNSSNLNVIKEIAQGNKQSVKDISISLKTLNDNKINENLLLRINKLSKENKNLADELYRISSKINNLISFQSSAPENKKVSKSVNNIVRLIKLKLENGSSFIEEVELLKDLAHNEEYLSNVEKLSIYATENFLGLNKLKTNFDQISSNYLNDYYLKKNNRYFIKHFYNLVLIQPNINGNIKDDTVLLLSLAKQNLLNKNLNESIKQLNTLNDDKNYFLLWIKQAKYYDQVINLLSKF